ncbi:MAG TPA: glycine--tRNA ligase subunit beta [Terriglobales bacterium]|nr:glycine--tRNA ligase subunit beta [Terriglobales bacterium]
MPDFLLEIGCEEIPARMIDAAREELKRRVSDVLVRERLAADPVLEPFSTPRRISVLARSISGSQPDLEEQVPGPSYKVAFKDGEPTPAAQAFSRKVGVDLAQLEKITTPKGEYLAARVVKKGRPAAEVLAELLPKEIAGLYWPKNMYWRPGDTNLRFVRPIRWLVAMLDGEAIPLEFAGIRAGVSSQGHRFLSSSKVSFASPAEYAGKLEQAGVIANPAEREQRVRKALDAATRALPGARWREDKELLNTVVNLTEFPSAILGSFDPQFLSLPEEVLVTVMRDHQKYFAVEDDQGKLAPHFLAVLNTDRDPEGLIRHGNERVLRARFNDARFFWDIDQKVPLRERIPLLKKVTFQKDLGSYYDKTRRVQRLASLVSEALRSAEIQVRPGVVHKATLLAKTDLTTELVKEFTELQGIVGGLYARVQQLDPALPEATRFAIADAIYDQYRPESMEDGVPRTLEGAVLSISDKADSIAGMFALGLVPSGSKDPFALRRQANGIVKTVAEHKLPLSLRALFKDAREGYTGSEAEPKFKTIGYTSEVADFFHERLEFYLREVCGYAYDVVNAVLAAGADDVADAIARAEAVAHVRPSEDFESISIAFKRMKNILRQAADTGKKIAPAMDAAAFTDEPEQALGAAVPQAAEKVRRLGEEKNYQAALQEIAQLRPVIDKFFDKVMVMVEDERVRANRLALLQAMLNEFSTMADFSEIVTEKK